jgi:hypothetical protein
LAVRTGEDRREKFVRIRAADGQTLEAALPECERAKKQLRSLLPREVWHDLLAVLPEVARLTADL